MAGAPVREEASWSTRLPEMGAVVHQEAVAFRRKIFLRIGSWPLTKRGDFDQQLIARLYAIEAPGAPCQFEIRHTSSAGGRRTRTSGRRSCRDRRMKGGMTGCGLKHQTSAPSRARRKCWENRRNRKPRIAEIATEGQRPNRNGMT